MSNLNTAIVLLTVGVRWSKMSSRAGLSRAGEMRENGIAQSPYLMTAIALPSGTYSLSSLTCGIEDAGGARENFSIL